MVSMTDNEASVIDEDGFAVRRTIRIAAPIEAVWRAVTEPAYISKWFGQAVLEGSGAGATGSLSFEGYGTIPLRVEAIDAPNMVSYAWSNDDAARSLPSELDEATATVFTFTLEPVDGGTVLNVVENGFERTSDPAVNMAEHAAGWVEELDKLVALLGREAG